MAATVFAVKFMVSMSGVAGVVSSPPESPTAWESFAVRTVAATVAVKKAQGQVVSVWPPVASKFQSVNQQQKGK